MMHQGSSARMSRPGRQAQGQGYGQYQRGTPSPTDSYEDLGPGAARTPRNQNQNQNPEAPNPWCTAGLQQLGGTPHFEIITLIEKMRASRLSQYIDLPQLAVCGDQSAGKSSVLTAVAEIPFPQNSTTCTRFATEVIMRRTPTESVSVRICSFRPAQRCEALVERQRTFGAGVANAGDLQSVGVLSQLIESAAQAMDFGDGGVTNFVNDDTAGARRGFSRDVLQIEVTGPDRTPLVLVDLPGLIQVGEHTQVVEQLVEDYMANPRTIVLCIVSAQNDLENQIILKKARHFDPRGVRTLGIITKPDKLDPGSNLEKRFVGLAKNNDPLIKFELGWHVLMNGSRPDNNGDPDIPVPDYDFVRRGEDEANFFGSNPLWLAIGRKNHGVETLRIKLSNLLLNHIKRELKDVKREIDEQLQKCREEIVELGEEMRDIRSMRSFLGEVAHRYQRLCIEAVWGKYSDASFFGTGFDDAYNDRYLRAVIRNYNEEFASIFWRYGHTIEVEGSNLAPSPPVNSRNNERNLERDLFRDRDHGARNRDHTRFGNCLRRPQELSRASAVKDWALPTTRRARGEEIGDGRNPVLVKLFFGEQSRNWESLARMQTNDCAEACRTFLHLVLDQVAPEDMQAPLRDLIENKMDQKLAQANIELSQMLRDAQCRHPIINEYQYRANSDASRARMRRGSSVPIPSGPSPTSIIESALLSAIGTDGDNDTVLTIRQAAEKLASNVVHDEPLPEPSPDLPPEEDEESNEAARCEFSLDEMLAYYKGARTRFVDNVMIQVIERHLVGELFDIFTAADVSAMTEEQVKFIADESPAKAAKRKELEETLRGLRDGAEICRKFGRHIPER